MPIVKLSDGQAQELAYIISHYRSEFSGELPSELKIEEAEETTLFFIHTKYKKITLNYDHSSFSASSWKLDNTRCNPVFQCFINAVCDYQMERSKRTFGGGEVYDPTNIVCEYLKKKIREFSASDFKQDNEEKGLFKVLKQHQNFVSALSNDRNIFPPGYQGQTMRSLLLRCNDYLISIIKDIDQQMSRQSLHGTINNLTIDVKNVIFRTVEYLFYALRGSHTSDSVSMQDILNNHRISLKESSLTRSWMLLHALLSSKAFFEVRSDISTRNYAALSVKQNKSTERLENQLLFENEASLYIKTEWNPGHETSQQARESKTLNRFIGGNLIPDRNRFRRWWSSTHSGINSYFQNDQELIKNFVKLHVLLERLAQFYSLCEKLIFLINYDGAKVWSSEKQYLLQDFQNAGLKLHAEIRYNIDAISECTQRYYGLLTQRNKSQHADWASNHTKAEIIKENLSSKLRHMFNGLNKIQSDIRIINSPAMQHEVESVFNEFQLKLGWLSQDLGVPLRSSVLEINNSHVRTFSLLSGSGIFSSPRKSTSASSSTISKEEETYLLEKSFH